MKEVICFHNPDEENGYLSNWYPASFHKDGVKFSTTEQYMMYEKARLFGDDKMMEKILKENQPSKIKAYGRKVQHYDDAVWIKNRRQIVLDGNLAKFSQHPELKGKLLASGDAILAECAVRDTIWGIGLSMKSPDRFHPDRWKGKNLLGEILMEVRSQLAS